MEIIFKGHFALRTPPKNLTSKDHLLFEHEFKKYIKPCTIEQLKKVDIFGNLLFDRKKLKFYVFEMPSRKISAKDKFKGLKLFVKRSENISHGIWIIDNLSINFFHWFTDALPRLLAADAFLNNHLILLPNEYKKFAYVSQSLEILDKRAFFFNQNMRVHVNNLLLPSYTAPTGNYNKELINQLRYKITKSALANIDKRIYISRQKAARRKITNEKYVIDLLLQYNFEIHFFEDYNLYDQIKVAQQCKIMVGLHGAGLTNMLFMSGKGKILELRNKNDNHNNCYFSLASELKHDYYYLECIGDNNCTQDANLTVNIKHLKAVLEQLLTES